MTLCMKKIFGKLVLAAVILLGLALPALAQQQGAPKVQKSPNVGVAQGTQVIPRTEKIYRLGPSDMLDVIVWREPQVSRTNVPVRPDGWISLPLVDDVKAAGRTPMELKLAITKALLNYLEAPKVYVMVKEARSQSCYILGNVSKPNKYTMTRPTTVLQAIAMAEGFNEWARKDDVVVIRTVGNSTVRLPFQYSEVLSGKKMEQNIVLNPGDTIVVP